MNTIKGTHWGLALALTAIGAISAQTAMAAEQKVPLPPPRPAILVKKQAIPATKQPAAPIARNAAVPQRHPPPPAGLSAYAQANVGLRGVLFESRNVIKPLPRPVSGPFAVAPTSVTSPEDAAAVKRVIEAARHGREADADVAEQSIRDPVARKLAEWVIVRSDNTNPNFARYAAFVTANPSWPPGFFSGPRAENALWNNHVDDATVLAFFASHRPSTAKGCYMLARALLAKGDLDGAAALVRHAWRHEDSGAEAENKLVELFGRMPPRADHKARMDQRFYAEDVEAGMRAANRLGGDELAIGRARAAVIKRLNNAKALLDAVPVNARRDPGYVFARVQWLRKENKPAEAGKLMLTVPQDPETLVDLNQWWLERRLLVRTLLDDGDPHTAYRVAREAAVPPQGNYRVDYYFTSGWIAPRYLHDPAAAASHFAHLSEGTDSPHALARGGYWQGGAGAAKGPPAAAKGEYRTAGSE